eukprot:2851174-Karenia_brevis.AAC.1
MMMMMMMMLMMMMMTTMMAMTMMMGPFRKHFRKPVWQPSASFRDSEVPTSSRWALGPWLPARRAGQFQIPDR